MIDVNDLVGILENLSYKSNLSKSFKHTLRKFPKKELFEEILSLRCFYENSEVLLKTSFNYRIKSMHSVKLKYDKYIDCDMPLKKCFNDLLGIRIIVDQYEDILTHDFPDYKTVDMTKGKKNDDGYRGVHLYFQKDNHHYPIEIQFNTERDRIFNDWLHIHVYKNYDKQTSNILGAELRKLFDGNKINDENKFKEELKNVLLSSKKIQTSRFFGNRNANR